MAAGELGTVTRRAVIIEDRHLGEQIGLNGRLGLVEGISHKGNVEKLQHYGAQVAVNGLGELVCWSILPLKVQLDDPP
jgi:hypothetical protein